MDVLTKEQRRKNMQAIRSVGTKAEIKLAKALWIQGYRYRKNNKTVFGKPDLTFKKLKIAIFVDGDYFHGRDWRFNKYRIKTNRKFWWEKIERNMERDKEVLEKLSSEGWIVLRFWDTDVHKNLSKCIQVIERTLKLQKNVQKIF